jgi:hypothetical protein
MMAFLKRIISWGCGREPTRALVIAGIHATVLTILISITSAYYIFTQDKIREMEMQILWEAEKINQVKFVRTFYSPTPSEFSKYSDPKTDLTAFVWNLFSLYPDMTHAQNLIPEMEIPTLPADRAAKALKAMNFLVHRYPFPESIGGSSNEVSLFDPKPLAFRDIAEVAKWVEDLAIAVDKIRTMPVLIEKRINDCLSDLKSRNKEWDEEWEKDHVDRTIMGEIDPYIIYDNYIHNIQNAYEISRSVKFYLNRVEMLGSRFVPKAQIIMVIVFTFLVFFSGVILPLFTDRVLRVALLLIPCGFYILAFSFLVYRLSI